MIQAGSLLAHLVVSSIWVGFAAVAWGVGHWIHDRANVTGPARLDRVWTGLATIVLFLQLWHFARPVDDAALLIVAGAGAAGLVRAARTRGQASLHAGWATAAEAAAVVLVTLWIANRSLAPLVAHDTEMYMVPAVEWALAWPHVPGLAALHGRLGFNSSNVVLAALIEVGPGPRAAPHLLNGFLLFLLAVRMSRHLPNLIDGTATRAAAFDLTLIGALVAAALDDQLVPGLSADVAVAVALFAGTSMLIEWLGREPADRGTGPLVGAISAFALAATFKLSAAVFAAGGVVVALGLLASRVRPEPQRLRAIVAIGILTTLLIGGWMTRGIVASGYPFYPATALPAAVDWRVPAEQADAEAAWIAHFARTWHDTDLANADSVAAYERARMRWLKPWAGAIATGRDRGLVSLGLAVVLVCGLAARVSGKRQATTPRSWLPAVPAAASLLFWFVAAPRPSLGFPAVWVLAGSAAAAWTGRLAAGTRARVTPAIAAIVALAAFGIAVRADHPDAWTSPRAWWWTIAATVDASDWYREPGPPELTTYRTASGLVVSVPASRNLCRRVTPPCTPHPQPGLRLRDPANLGSGFTIDGSWQPARWPNPSSRFLDSWRRARH